jgi:hypothetical protein
MYKYTLPFTTELLLSIINSMDRVSYLLYNKFREYLDFTFLQNWLKNIHNKICTVFDDTSGSLSTYMIDAKDIFYKNIYLKVWFNDIMWCIELIILVRNPSFLVELKHPIITINVSIWEKFNPTFCAWAVIFYILLQQ